VPTLPELRAAIDQADRDLLEVLARRMALCNEVAAVKGQDQTQVLQPTRVREVLETRMAWGAERGLDREFVELVFRLLLSETHRIEAVHLRSHGTPADAGAARPAIDTALQTAACRVDHVTVAVEDLDAALSFFVDRLGFRVVQPRTTDERHPGLDSAVVDAGGVTFVLLQAAADRDGGAVEAGVHHIAIEVLNAAFVRDDLGTRGLPLPTGVLTTDNGLERFFTVRESGSGLQLGFVSRTGDRGVFDGGDLQALSAAIEAAG